MPAFEDAPSSHPPGTLPISSTYLPNPLSRFIGREREILELRRLLADARLVTLTGPGGGGKTRLALEVAHELVRQENNQVCWVELASLNDPALVPQEVAAALGLLRPGNPPATERLVAFLCARPLVLVLDNCDHLIDACAQLAYMLASRCPDLKVLATSREALRIEGEVNWIVPPLTVPPPEQWTDLQALEQSEAIQLFVERARAVSPRFTLTRQNALAVSEICYQLDGMPMAIELAAARIQVLAPEQIASRLDDRFNLLVGSSRTGQLRHQTLRATIDWSYDLLAERERELLCRLAVFVNGWTLHAAEDICAFDPIERGDVLELISLLVTKSLVQVSGEGTRYRMLGTIRQYALEKARESGGTERARANHLDFLVRLAREADPKLRSSEQLVWFEGLEQEHDNLRAALDWAIQQDPERALILVGAMNYFWYVRGYAREGSVWAERALAHGKDTSPSAQAMAHRTLGVLLLAQGNLASSIDHLQAGRSLYSKTQDKAAASFVQTILGVAFFNSGDLETARQLWDASLAIRRELGDPWAIAQTLQNYTELAKAEEDWVRLEQVADETVELFRAAGDQRGVGRTLGDLAYAQQKLGNFEWAAAIFAEALQSVWQVKDRGSFAQLLEGLAPVMALQGKPEAAARLGGAAEALREAIAYSLLPSERDQYQEILETLLAELGQEKLAIAWAEGRAMTPVQVLEYAIYASKLSDQPEQQASTKSARRQAKQKYGGLTSRERQVAALIGQGKSNRAIAEELVVTERTVEKHVENILSKLEFHSRTLIAAWAVDRGLASPPE